MMLMHKSIPGHVDQVCNKHIVTVYRYNIRHPGPVTPYYKISLDYQLAIGGGIIAEVT